MPKITLVDLGQIRAAQKVISGRLHRTRMTRSAYLSDQLGIDLHLKLEMFQKTGSFKPRGVLNKLHHLSPEEHRRGVISVSSGNHAQALAYAASSSGVRSTIVMPAGAVASKVNATRGYGGKIVFTDGDLLETVRSVQEEQGLTMVHPFDDPMIIAGAGTTGMEIVEDLPDVDVVVVGVGGGGLISGVAAAIKLQRPNAKIIGVEPEGARAMTLSLQAGKLVQLDSVDTVADGLAPPFTGEHNLSHVQGFVDEVVIVTDDEIVEAMAIILERTKVVAEPAAASTLAALLSGKATVAAKSKVVCLLSGGNIDRRRLASLLGS